MAKLEVFFDYECPYCMRGVDYLLKHLPKHPTVEVEWLPIEGHPRPEVHPPHTDLAIQGFHYAVEQGVDPVTYNNRLFKAIHEDGIDVEDPAALAEYVKDLVDPADYEQALRDGTYRKVQEAGNDYAYEEHDVWFIPVFMAGDKRLDAEGGIGVSEEDVAELLRSLDS